MRVLAVDYGKKRCGIAVTDEMQMIASGLTTVDNALLLNYLKEYTTKYKVEAIVFGQPKFMDGQAMELEQDILAFIEKMTLVLPTLHVVRIDERFTSKMAMASMVAGGLKKKDRNNKALLDEVSATIILQSYLETKR